MDDTKDQLLHLVFGGELEDLSDELTYLREQLNADQAL